MNARVRSRLEIICLHSLVSMRAIYLHFFTHALSLMLPPDEVLLGRLITINSVQNFPYPLGDYPADPLSRKHVLL